MIRKTSISAVFFLLFFLFVNSQEAEVPQESDKVLLLRGPYLQAGTKTSMIIKWRTDHPTGSRVIYGTQADNLNQNKSDEKNTKDHEILLADLKENTKYYYAIGNETELFIEDDPSYYFVTSPDRNHDEVIRIWAIGDFGTGDVMAERVKNGYLKYSQDKHTDVWLMLGDIAYYYGEEYEFQRSIFNGAYSNMMSNTVIWPTPGNHDMRSADSESETGPYYDIFTVPENGEAGGEPSGKEAYYSFNYGNIHFISLDSHDTSRDKDGGMASWLKRDLENDNHKWKIVIFHHPPYSKGTHDSDNDMDSNGRMKEMRENFLPIIENYGVDLVLGGHSHTYERSYLLKGHYGYSDEFDPDLMIIRNDNVKEKNKSDFVKKMDNQGTIYIVCGVSGGHVLSGKCNHPAMAVSQTEYHGSMSIEIHDNTMSGALIDEYGKVKDRFTITKDRN
jgi:hypothetical protein